jgi:hypothetical protein
MNAFECATGLASILHDTRSQMCILLYAVLLLEQGRSTLMNFLMRGNEFVVSSANQPCTQGVDVSSTFLTQAQFLDGNITATATDKPLLTFIDVEGSVSTQLQSYALFTLYNYLHLLRVEASFNIGVLTRVMICYSIHNRAQIMLAMRSSWPHRCC